MEVEYIFFRRSTSENRIKPPSQVKLVNMPGTTSLKNMKMKTNQLKLYYTINN